jgi:RHS repeat-associated protein
VVTRSHDKLNRLREIRSAPSAEGLPLAYEYQYNDASQRVRTTLADGGYWLYEYDTLGQVKSGKRYWNDGTLVAGQQFEYGHDGIGNRKSASKGGDQNGNNLRTTTYTANSLNQYTARTTPGFVEVLGIANSGGTVTVNGTSSGVYRRGEYFRRELSVANSGGPVRESVTVGASFGGQNATPESGGIYLPRSSETTSHITYDLDGNLTGDSLWSYVWDGENRLIELAMKAGTGISGSTRLRLLFDYDFQGRRIQKRVFTHNGTGWTQDTAKTRKFVYDGWNLIAELDGSNNRVRTYVWGLDLSGTMQGAGGVGGLLVVSQHTPSMSHHFVAYDGNGNVTGLINAADGKYSARYEYGPFGEPVRVTGGMGRNNPFRFSTKFTDDESGLLYYGFRFYDPSTGRWLSRDPLGELGPDGANIYAFVRNMPQVLVDTDGRASFGVYYDPNGNWAYPHGLPQPPPPPAPPKKRPGLAEGLRGCCDNAAVEKGERELKNRFQQAAARASQLGITPVDPGQVGASCKNSSADILRWLAPFPSCWTCYLEVRDRRVYIWQYDHQVIVCLGYTKDSRAPKEIMFDWWGDTKHHRNWSGGPAERFRYEYPLNPGIAADRYSGAVTGCDGIPVHSNLPQDCNFGACLEAH